MSTPRAGNSKEHPLHPIAPKMGGRKRPHQCKHFSMASGQVLVINFSIEKIWGSGTCMP
jgi:hypothetical protein